MPAESSLADQVEGLVAAGGRIGVDVLAGRSGRSRHGLKPWMRSCLAPTRLSAALLKSKVSGAGAAELHVPAEAADQQVVAVLALEQVLAAFAEAAGRCRPRP